MTSVVSICNLALSNIGKDNIQSLSDAGAEARACNQFYDHTRNTLLQSYPWRFAGLTKSLGQITNTRVGRWGYAYARPSDCLKVRAVRGSFEDADAAAWLDETEEPSAPYELEGDVIFSDLSPAFLRYTSRLTDPTKFSPMFVDALSWHLSARLAMPMTRDLKQRNAAVEMARLVSAQAEMADANEVRSNSDHTSEMVTGRG